MNYPACTFGDGVVIKPNGVDELEACDYKLTEIHENVRVEVLRCKHCGQISYGWFRQEDTIDTYLPEEDE